MELSSSGDLPSDPWQAFAHDPRNASNAVLRASDADREVVARILGGAYADGRLDREELDQRSESATSSRTLGEIPALISDLVPEVSARGRLTPVQMQHQARQAWTDQRRHAVLGFIGPSLICWAIWVALGMDTFPWPLIVSAVTLVHLLRTMVNRRQIEAEHLARLQKRQARELKRRGRW